MKLFSSFFVAFLLFGGTAKEQTLEDFVKAEREIKRLAPAAFPELPRALVRKLEQRGCTIPQTSFISEPHNVIQGEFAKKGEKDWAVLCSKEEKKEGKSAVLIFWGAPTDCPDEMPWMKDQYGLQGLGGNKIGYSIRISPVDKKYIMDHFESYGGPKPPPIDHQGIDSAFLGKASVVLYCHEGKWLSLTGAD